MGKRDADRRAAGDDRPLRHEAERTIVEARALIGASLREEGCVHYAWTLDPLTPGRVYVLEKWTSQAALEGHFHDASNWGIREHLRGFRRDKSTIRKYRFDAKACVYDDDGAPRADFFERGDAA